MSMIATSGARQLDFAAQLPGGADLADDVEASLGQQAVKPGPEQAAMPMRSRRRVATRALA
jgi:hypothetical protein